MYRELSAKHEPPLCSTSWVEWRGGFFAFGGSLFAPLLPQPWAGEGGGLFCVGIIATKAPTDLCRPTMAPSSTGHCEGHTACLELKTGSAGTGLRPGRTYWLGDITGQQ